MTNIIEIKGLKKSFENHEALRGIHLEIPQGRIFGLLGPNGAGKTTLIRNITQIYQPDAGEIFFKGEKLSSKHIKNMSYMPEERGLYKKMKIGEHLIYLARLKGLSSEEAHQKIDKWFSHFDIEDWKNKKVEDLSKGMQQKVQFIATILNDPELLILDEPFSGLDPINSNLIKDEMLSLAHKGTTIIFSTHRMESVEELCEDMALINKGEIILQGNIKQIRKEYRNNLYQITLDEGEIWPEEQLNQYTPESNDGQNIKIILKEGQTTNQLLTDIMATGKKIVGFYEILPTVNEIFIKKVNESNHG